MLDPINCRAPGCTDEARSDRGIYAYLCDHHVEQKRKTGVSPRPVGNGSAPAMRANPDDSLEAKVKELGKLGKAVDTRRAVARRLTEQALRAKAEADALEQAFQARMRELMGAE